MNARTVFSTRSAIVALAAAVLGTQAAAAQPHDVVIANGRVMDPESGRDEIAHVGIDDGRIVSISKHSLGGKRTIDATGLVVAPGFIDLHAHGQSLTAQDLQVRDGVTTALEQELGAYPISAFYSQREGRSRINFGASVSHQGIRAKIKTGVDAGHPSTNVAVMDSLLREKARWAEAAMSEAETARGLELFRDEVRAGGLGIGLATEYVPGTDRREAYLFMKEAAQLRVPVFTHVRMAHHAGVGGLFEMVQEVLANAAATGSALHVCHVTSKGLQDTALILDAISNARRNGMDVTTEAYPYTAGSTMLGSALFNEGWRERWNADYGDIEWPATGERLTEATFARYRADEPAAVVIFHMIPQVAMDLAIEHPAVMIASDGGAFINGRGHPRGAGTYARVLGHYVRERGSLPLMSALAKMTVMPARRLERIAPAMRRKGRLQEGMDADITIFNPATVIDRATYQEPAVPSAGIAYVLVGGVAVVVAGKLDEGVFPGRGVRSEM